MKPQRNTQADSILEWIALNWPDMLFIAAVVIIAGLLA
jgi:hypothetical protein